MIFNFIEGQYSRLSKEDYEGFKDDYLHSELSTHQVREKWGLSKKEYSLITKEIRDELGIGCRPFTKAKNFYKVGNSWHILKTINHKTIIYGVLPFEEYDENDMVEIVKKCKNMDWEYTLCREYLCKLE